MAKKDFKDIKNLSRIKKFHRLPEMDKRLTEMNAKVQIAYAINNDLKVDFFYQDDQAGGQVLRGYRSVSPVAIGTHVTSGNEVFRAYLNEGVSKSKRTPKWRLFRVDRVTAIKVYFSPTKAKFDKLYRANDKHIGTIEEQAWFTKQQNKRRVQNK